MLVVTFRTVVVYILIMVVFRAMGKRQLGELSPNELVTTVLISNLASLPIEDTDIPVLSAFVPILLIAAFEVFMSFFEIKSAKFSAIVSGNSKTIIWDGKLDQTVMKELLYSIDDVLEALRAKDIFDISQVSWAVVETNGAVNVCTREDAPTVKDVPVPAILDGQLKKENLSLLGIDTEKLEKSLCERRIVLSDICVAWVRADELEIIYKEKQ